MEEGLPDRVSFGNRFLYHVRTLLIVSSLLGGGCDEEHFYEPDEIMTSQQRRHVVHITPIYCVWHSNNATATDAHSECLDTLDIATELDETIIYSRITCQLPGHRCTESRASKGI